MEVVWSDLAMRDLNDIAFYVSEQFGVSVAEKSINKIVKTVERLRLFPTSGVLDKAYSSCDFSVRHVTIAPNAVYYLLEENAIVVMTIVHVKRSPRHVNKVLKYYLEHYER